jgi:hypothetical protein
MNRRLELCKSRALGFRPFLAPLRKQSYLNEWDQSMRERFVGCLRHNPVEVSLSPRVVQTNRMHGGVDAHTRWNCV